MTNASAENTSPDASPVVIVVKRTFDAPAEAVFDAWLDPAAAGRWLFATPNSEMQRVEIDARVGGGFNITEKRGDELAEHLGTYEVIERPHRLVFTFATNREATPTRVTVEITPLSHGCELSLTHTIDPKWAAFAERTRHGWTTILQGLANTMSNENNLKDYEFVISRELDAPQALVWKAWTEAERLAQWWGPKGCKITVKSLDFRPGGIFHYLMKYGGDNEMYGRFVYGTIEPTERLDFVNSFSDESAGVIRAPFAASFPLEVSNTLTLEDRGGRTLLTLRGLPINATPEEMEFFKGMHSSMQGGWSGTMEQLEAYLESAS